MHKYTIRGAFTFNNALGLYFEKIEWGVTYLSRMNSLQILCVTENMLNGEISTKSVYISQLIIIQISHIFLDSNYISTLMEGLSLKKSSHATAL
jgi:hypothetical protein